MVDRYVIDAAGGMDGLAPCFNVRDTVTDTVVEFFVADSDSELDVFEAESAAEAFCSALCVGDIIL